MLLQNKKEYDQSFRGLMTFLSPTSSNSPFYQLSIQSASLAATRDVEGLVRIPTETHMWSSTARWNMLHADHVNLVTQWARNVASAPGGTSSEEKQVTFVQPCISSSVRNRISERI